MDNFTFDILEICKKEELSQKEIYWIKYFNSMNPNGYNLTAGGDGGNTFKYRSPEEMTITKKKIKLATTGINNGFYGKHHSEKTKEYLRKINIGKVISESHRKKMSESLKGHYMPDSAKKKISESTKKQWENVEFKEYMKKVNSENQYAKNNKWNCGRINVYDQEMKHKRILKNELDEYLRNGYKLGIPPTSKLHDNRPRETPYKNNTSGYPGVRFDKTLSKWVVYLNYMKKRYYGGMHITKKEAIEARKELEKRIINNQNSPL